MREINISSAPINYRMYLREADAHKAANGKIDTEAEAESAAKAICKENGDECERFLDFMERSSGYRPSRFKKELELEEASKVMVSYMPLLQGEGKYAPVGSEAANKLGEIAQKDISDEDRSKIVEVLIQSLGNKTSDGRSVSAAALAGIVKSKISPEMKAKIVDALIGYIGDKDNQFRISVAESIVMIAESNISLELKSKVVVILIKCLTHKNTDVRSTAAHALGMIEGDSISRELRLKIVNALIRSLGDDWNYRGVVEDALFGIADSNPSSGQTSEMVGSLVKLLDDSFARSSAKETLGKIGKLTGLSSEVKSTIVDAFIRLLAGEKPGASNGLSDELSEMAKTTKSQALRAKISDALVEYIGNLDWAATGDNIPTNELQALIMLNISQELNSKCFDALIHVLNGNSETNSNAAALIIKDILLKSVSNSGAHINISEEAGSKLIDALIKHMSDRTDTIRSDASQWALDYIVRSKIPQEFKAKIVNAFIEYLGDSNHDVRLSAASGLAELTQNGFAALDNSPGLKPKIIDALIAGLNSYDDDIQTVAINGLRNIAGSSSTLYLFESLVKLIRNEDPRIKRVAIMILGTIADLDTSKTITQDLRAEIVEYMITMVNTDTNEGVRDMALLVLGQIEHVNDLPEEIKSRIKTVIKP